VTPTVWKFPLSAADDQQFGMPAGARPIHVGLDGGDTACLWAVVDPEQPREIRHFRLAGTGHPLPDDPGTHLGSFVLGPLVFHLFDLEQGRHG
jgi:hypothetical protein